MIPACVECGNDDPCEGFTMCSDCLEQTEWSNAMTCIIAFPQNTELTTVCPRCGGEAGDHPAPLALAEVVMGVREPSIFGRPTLREALSQRNA